MGDNVLAVVNAINNIGGRFEDAQQEKVDAEQRNLKWARDVFQIFYYMTFFRNAINNWPNGTYENLKEQFKYFEDGVNNPLHLRYTTRDMIQRKKSFPLGLEFKEFLKTPLYAIAPIYGFMPFCINGVLHYYDNGGVSLPKEGEENWRFHHYKNVLEETRKILDVPMYNFSQKAPSQMKQLVDFIESGQAPTFSQFDMPYFAEGKGAKMILFQINKSHDDDSHDYLLSYPTELSSLSFTKAERESRNDYIYKDEPESFKRYLKREKEDDIKHGKDIVKTYYLYCTVVEVGKLGGPRIYLRKKWNGRAFPSLWLGQSRQMILLYRFVFWMSIARL